MVLVCHNLIAEEEKAYLLAEHHHSAFLCCLGQEIHRLTKFCFILCATPLQVLRIIECACVVLLAFPFFLISVVFI